MFVERSMKYRNTLFRKTLVSLIIVLSFFSISNTYAENQKNNMSHDMHSMHHGSPSSASDSNKISKKKLFKASLKSNDATPPLHKIHNWTVHVETINGDPVENAKINVYGGMPSHKHGYSTNPQITKNLGNGDYLVEGIKFSMAGYWEMWFNIRADKNQDIVIFGLNISSPYNMKNVKSNQWNTSELTTLRNLWIESLPPLADDPSNRFANDPRAAVLGEKLFFDPRFSANGKISCASCHDPALQFTDGKAVSKGIANTRRSSPSLIGISHSPWFFWDGRADSQWAQALAPLEDAREHAGNRTQYVHIIQQDKNYKQQYEAVFGVLPDMSDTKRFPKNAGPVRNEEASDAWAEMTKADKEMVNGIFVNIGKSIAAYERKLTPTSSRFDNYVGSLFNKNTDQKNNTLSKNEIEGLKVFMGKGMCTICHNGPQFTTHGFKNIGLPTVKRLGKDRGRYDGMKDAILSKFNCIGKYSDAKKEDCTELNFIKTLADDTLGAFKIPSLRNVSKTAPYMHSGQFKTLSEVLKHYKKRPITRKGHTDLLPNKLNDDDLIKLEAFLKIL